MTPEIISAVNCLALLIFGKIKEKNVDTFSLKQLSLFIKNMTFILQQDYKNKWNINKPFQFCTLRKILICPSYIDIRIQSAWQHTFGISRLNILHTNMKIDFHYILFVDPGYVAYSINNFSNTIYTTNNILPFIPNIPYLIEYQPPKKSLFKTVKTFLSKLKLSNHYMYCESTASYIKL